MSSVEMSQYKLTTASGETKYAEAWDAVDLVAFLGGVDAMRRDYTKILVWVEPDDMSDGRWTHTVILTEPEGFLARTPARWLDDNPHDYEDYEEGELNDG